VWLTALSTSACSAAAASAAAPSSFDYALLGILDDLEGVLMGKKRK